MNTFCNTVPTSMSAKSSHISLIVAGLQRPQGLTLVTALDTVCRWVSWFTKWISVRFFFYNKGHNHTIFSYAVRMCGHYLIIVQVQWQMSEKVTISCLHYHNVCTTTAVNFMPFHTWSSLNAHSQWCELIVYSVRSKPFHITIRINAWAC